MSEQVEAVHTRFMTELLMFDDGIDLDLASQLTTGVALRRLVDGVDVAYSTGYDSSVEAVVRLGATEYEVRDCSRDLSAPEAPAQLRTTRIVASGGNWRVAQFHTGSQPCRQAGHAGQQAEAVAS